MSEQLYIQELENRLFELTSMLTDPSLYSFLSDKERERLGFTLTQASENRDQYTKIRRYTKDF